MAKTPQEERALPESSGRRPPARGEPYRFASTEQGKRENRPKLGEKGGIKPFDKVTLIWRAEGSAPPPARLVGETASSLTRESGWPRGKS